MTIALCIRTSMLAINLYFVCLQIEKVVLDHLSVKHVWNLLCILYYFVKKVVVSGVIGSYFILLQTNRILLVYRFVYQVLWLSWNVQG